MESVIQTLAIYALPVVFAITLHEAAHGYVARHFGDPTAWMLGRISLNPLRHIDPVGTVLVPAILFWTTHGAFLFGWAKPVPVDFGKLRQPKKDMFWVAAAGPAANLAMALGWAALLKLVELAPENVYSLPMARMADAGMDVNIVLMVLNLFPLPPLDGGRIAVSLLPPRAAAKFAAIEPYGLFILLATIPLGILGYLMAPLMSAYFFLVMSLLGF